MDVAIGNQLICVFVDHGLLRYKESEEISEIFTKRLGRFVKVDASDLFLEALKGIKDLEVKRKIIGNKFIEVFEKEAKKLKSRIFSGTIFRCYYPSFQEDHL